MDIMGYTVLSEKTLPNFLKGRPQVVMCLAFLAAFLMVTTLSITIGIFMGYTYCYLEHRSGPVKANLTRTHIKIMDMKIPAHDLHEHDNKTRTINGALLKDLIVAKLLNTTHYLWSAKNQTLLPMAEVAGS